MSTARKGIREKHKKIFVFMVIASFIMTIVFSQIYATNETGLLRRDCVECIEVDYTCSICEFVKGADNQLRLLSTSTTLPIYAILISTTAAYTTVDFHSFYTLIDMHIRMNN